MADDFVNKIEFNALKEEVNEIKKEMAESSRILQAIDKKIDIINEKLVTSDKIDDLKFAPIEKRVKSLEENQTWIWRTIAGAIIGVIITIIVNIAKTL